MEAITKGQIRQALRVSDDVVKQAVCRLTNLQEAYERSAKTSIYKNRRGFKKQHGSLATFAEKIWRGEELSAEEYAFLRHPGRLPVYAQQLANLATAGQLRLPIEQ